MKSKDERKAVYSALDKLRQLGPRIAPPHAKLLQGAADLMELRPRQGASPIRPLYRRYGESFVVLAVATKSDFDAKVAEASNRAAQYDD